MFGVSAFHAAAQSLRDRQIFRKSNEFSCHQPARRVVRVRHQFGDVCFFSSSIKLKSSCAFSSSISLKRQRVVWGHFFQNVGGALFVHFFQNTRLIFVDISSSVSAAISSSSDSTISVR
jgi:hypothetical protein